MHRQPAPPASGAADVQAAEVQKEAGNQLFRAGRYEEALGKYCAALSELQNPQRWPAARLAGYISNADSHSRTLLASLLANRAQACLRLAATGTPSNKWGDDVFLQIIGDCTCALRVLAQPGSTALVDTVDYESVHPQLAAKARHRRASALAALGNLASALVDRAVLVAQAADSAGAVDVAEVKAGIGQLQQQLRCFACDGRMKSLALPSGPLPHHWPVHGARAHVAVDPPRVLACAKLAELGVFCVAVPLGADEFQVHGSLSSWGQPPALALPATATCMLAGDAVQCRTRCIEPAFAPLLGQADTAACWHQGAAFLCARLHPTRVEAMRRCPDSSTGAVDDWMPDDRLHVWQWLPQHQQWRGTEHPHGGEPVPAPFSPRGRYSLVAAGGRLYLYGGAQLVAGVTVSMAVLGELWACDLHNSAWQRLWPAEQSATSQQQQAPGSGSPAARYGHASWAYEDYVYIWGGVPGGPSLQGLGDMWRWNIARSCWEEVLYKGNPPSARFDMGWAASADGARAYIVAGRVGTAILREPCADVFEFDCTAHLWRQVLPNVPNCRWFASNIRPVCAMLPGNQLLILNGIGFPPPGSPPLSSVPVLEDVLIIDLTPNTATTSDVGANMVDDPADGGTSASAGPAAPSGQSQRTADARSNGLRHGTAPVSTAEKYAGIHLTFPPDGRAGAVQLTARDLSCLDPGQPISDRVIALYIEHLKLQLGTQTLSRCFFFNSFFYTKLTLKDSGTGTEYEQAQRVFARVSRWTKGVDIFARDYLFAPIYEQRHWSLFIICNPGAAEQDYKPGPRRPCLLHLDSQDPGHDSQVIAEHLRRYLGHEWVRQAIKGKLAGPPAKDNVSAAWHFANSGVLRMWYEGTMPCVRVKVPLQPNSYDGGLFLLTYLEFFLHALPDAICADSAAHPEELHSEYPGFLTPHWFPPSNACALRVALRLFILEELHDAILAGDSPEPAGGLALLEAEVAELNVLCDMHGSGWQGPCEWLEAQKSRQQPKQQQPELQQPQPQQPQLPPGQQQAGALAHTAAAQQQARRVTLNPKTLTNREGDPGQAGRSGAGHRSAPSATNGPASASSGAISIPNGPAGAADERSPASAGDSDAGSRPDAALALRPLRRASMASTGVSAGTAGGTASLVSHRDRRQLGLMLPTDRMPTAWRSPELQEYVNMDHWQFGVTRDILARLQQPYHGGLLIHPHAPAGEAHPRQSPAGPSAGAQNLDELMGMFWWGASHWKGTCALQQGTRIATAQVIQVVKVFSTSKAATEYHAKAAAAQMGWIKQPRPLPRMQAAAARLLTAARNPLPRPRMCASLDASRGRLATMATELAWVCARVWVRLHVRVDLDTEVRPGTPRGAQNDFASANRAVITLAVAAQMALNKNWDSCDEVACLLCEKREAAPVDVATHRASKARIVKVCRGCRLVRFCSAACQRACWHAEGAHIGLHRCVCDAGRVAALPAPAQCFLAPNAKEVALLEAADLYD